MPRKSGFEADLAEAFDTVGAGRSHEVVHGNALAAHRRGLRFSGVHDNGWGAAGRWAEG